MLKIIGISNSDNKNNPIMLMEATIPNCFIISLSTIINVAKPDAVVRFVKNVEFPILIPAAMPLFYFRAEYIRDETYSAYRCCWEFRLQ